MALNLQRQTEMFATTSQIALEDIPQLKALGFRSVVINRPDNEANGMHPQSVDVRRAAEQVGLEVAYLPVIPNQITDSDVQAFSDLLSKLPSPLVAYCASGARASMLFAKSQSSLVSKAVSP